MPLEKREIEVPLGSGLDLKSGAETADASTSLSESVNLRFNRAGSLEKRPTFASQATPSAPTGGDYGTCKATTLFTRDDQVCVLTDSYGVAYPDPDNDSLLMMPTRDRSSAGGLQVAQYAPLACSVSRHVIERTQFGFDQGGIYHATAALYGNTMVFAWIEIRGGNPILKYRAVDATTGKVITPTASTTLTSATSFAVQACAYAVSGATGVAITYAYGTAAPYTIRTVLWSSTSKTFAASSDLTTNSKYVTHSLATFGTSGIYLAFTDNTSNVLKAHAGTIAQINGGTSTLHTGTTAGVIPGCFVVGSSQVLIGTYKSTTVYAERFGTPAGVATMITADSNGAVTESFVGMTGAQDVSANRAVLWVSCVAAESWGNMFRVRCTDVDFSTSTPAYVNGQDVIYNAWIATAGFSYGGRAFVGINCGQLSTSTATSVVLMRYTSQSQSIAYTRHDAVARLCHDRFFTGLLGTQNNFAPVMVLGSTAHLVLTGDPSEAEVASYGAVLPQTIYRSAVAFPDLSGACVFPLPSAEYGGVSYLASGILCHWDGDTFAEQTPLSRPVVYVDTTPAGSTTTSDTMSVCAIWRWVDAQGNLHRTRPSEADTVAVVTNKRIDVYVTAPPTTALDGTAPWQALEPELYITEQGGSTYYLAGSSGEKLVATSSVWGGCFYVFTNVQPGSTALPQLYSTGASGTETVPEPTPAFRDITRVGDRLLAIDAEDTSRLWFTKPFAAGFAPEWSTTNTLTVGDDCMAVRGAGGFPVVFAAGGVYRISGVGPDELGNGLFEPAIRLHEVGCIDRLVCSTAQGVVFRGRRGLYLLDQGGGLQPFGAQLDSLLRVPDARSYTYARIVEDDVHNEVIVIDDYGDNLAVYNALEQKWSTWDQDETTQNMLDAVTANGRLWYLHWDGSAPVLRRQYGVDEASYNAGTEGWSIATHWMRPDGLAGQGRLWRLFVHVVLPSDPADITALTVQLYNNYSDTVVQTVTWTGAELATVYGAGAEQTARLSIVPAQQVVTAFKVRVSCTFTAASSGPRPLNLRLSYGVRPSKGKQARPGVK